MSIQYDNYLKEHKANVIKGFEWMRENLPDLIRVFDNGNIDLDWQICLDHDQSKTDQEEYGAYDAYFYGNNRSFGVVQDFNKAWLHHIHNNPHHWQHWILINDDPDEGEILISMPLNYIIEMICDWWSFSWSEGDLTSIFKWYNEHKNIRLANDTHFTVNDILNQIKQKLEKKE